MTDRPGQPRPAGPPPAPRIPVTDTYHGTKVTDPYRWMETDTGRLSAWLTAQAGYCEQALQAIPGRQAARQACAGLSAADAQVVNVQTGGDYVFYLKRGPGSDIHRLVARSRQDDRERTLIDPAAHVTGAPAHHVSIDWYSASPDGRFVAYGLSSDGSELATLHVVDVAAAAPLPVTVTAVSATRMTRARHPGVSWHPDSAQFVYHRLTSSDGTAKYQNMQVGLYKAQAGAGDAVVEAVGRIRDLAVGQDDTPIVTFSDDGRWLAVGVRTGSKRTCPVYLGETGRSGWSWRQVSAAATSWQIACGGLYLLEPGRDGRGRITRSSLVSAGAPVVLVEGGPVVEDFWAAAGSVLLRCLDGGLSAIARVGDAGGPPVPVSLPHAGSVTELAYDRAAREYVLGLSSWTKSMRILRLVAGADRCTETGWLPAASFESPMIVSRPVTVIASDGAEVPMTIVCRADLRRDGGAPAVISAYGFFGITLRATFNPVMTSWVDGGGVWVIAHVRGGGEGGEAWASAGHGIGQERTIADLNDCADHLVRAGWTAPDRLAAEGTSAGGLTVAGAMARAPGKFAAVVLRVPVTNTLRLEMHENGPPNIPEYGSVSDPDGFAGLLVSDVCHRICAGTAYPPTLLTMGLHDPRVTPFQPAKLAAHLQHASSSGHAVLLRIEEHGGHGPGSTKDQLDDEAADRLTFLRAVLPDSRARSRAGTPRGKEAV